MTTAPEAPRLIDPARCDWPELPERNGYEMVDGAWARMPMGNDSLDAAFNVVYHLRQEAERAGGRVATNEASIQIWRDSPKTYRKPDGMYYVRGRLPDGLLHEGHLHDIPDIVIEGISKSEKGTDILEKVAAYLEVGVRLVWVLFPQTRVVMVFRPGRSVSMLGPGDVLSGEDVVPGFSLAVDRVFGGA